MNDFFERSGIDQYLILIHKRESWTITLHQLKLSKVKPKDCFVILDIKMNEEQEIGYSMGMILQFVISTSGGWVG